jgi:hypothetical protein
LSVLIDKQNRKSGHLTLHYDSTGCGVFKRGGTKLEIFLHKYQLTQRKLLNFEFWINGELSKIGHHFNNKKNLKHDFIKKCQ